MNKIYRIIIIGIASQNSTININNDNPKNIKTNLLSLKVKFDILNENILIEEFIIHPKNKDRPINKIGLNNKGLNSKLMFGKIKVLYCAIIGSEAKNIPAAGEGSPIKDLV